MPQMPNITVQLVHIQGPLKGQIQDFFQFPVQIGRHSSCQVRFEKDLTAISRRHARIERQGNRFRIIDASTNGTYVNGKRIADVYLRDGDVITFSENGPKASFLTKVASGDASSSPVFEPVPPAPPLEPSQNHVAPPAPVQPQMPLPTPTGPTPPPTPQPGITVGPDTAIPVMSTTAPLVIQFGPTLQSYNVLPVTIGTDPSCDFVIDHPALAGQHLQIFFGENDYWVKDLTGRNVVSINGRPVGTQSILAQGAELALTEQGPKFRFLGGGRLAEMPDAKPDELDKTDADPSLQNVGNGVESVPKRKDAKSGSLFKGFFK